MPSSATYATQMLVEQGIVTKTDDPSHKQKAIYSLTEKGIDLLPILAQVGIWGRRYGPVTPESAATAACLEKGGPALWAQLMADLRQSHLGTEATDQPQRGFRGRLDTAS